MSCLSTAGNTIRLKAIGYSRNLSIIVRVVQTFDLSCSKANMEPVNISAVNCCIFQHHTLSLRSPRWHSVTPLSTVTLCHTALYGDTLVTPLSTVTLCHSALHGDTLSHRCPRWHSVTPLSTVTLCHTALYGDTLVTPLSTVTLCHTAVHGDTLSHRSLRWHSVTPLSTVTLCHTAVHGDTLLYLIILKVHFILLLNLLQPTGYFTYHQV